MKTNRLLMRAGSSALSMAALAGIIGLGQWAGKIQESAAVVRAAALLAMLAVIGGSWLVLFMQGAHPWRLAAHALLGAGALAAIAPEKLFIWLAGLALLLVAPLVLALCLGWTDPGYSEDY
jgi:hypothetical protein